MRTKKSIINYLTVAVPTIIIGILGFFKVKLFLSVLGKEIQGIYLLYNQLFVYLSLAEGGLNSAVLFELFSPLAKGNDKEVSKILSATRQIFNYIGILILFGGIIICLNLQYFINTTTISYDYIQIAFLVFLVSEIINYFFAANSIIFRADQKLYKINLITQSSLIFRNIIEIILLLLNFDLIVIFFSHILINLFSNLLILYFSKVEYKNINFKEKEKNYSVLKNIKNLLPHKIGTLVSNNIDIIIISSFINLTSVAIYGAYNYIITFINRLILQIIPAITPSIGNYVVSENNNNSLFFELNTLLFFISVVICIPLYFFLNPFINLWVGRDMLLSNFTSLLFIVILFFNIIIIPIHSYTGAMGLFKETRLATIIQSIINILISLFLVRKIGIQGVLLGTIISYIVDYFYRVSIVLKHVANGKNLLYYKNLFKHLFCLFILGIINYFFSKYYALIITKSILMWFIYGMLIFILNFGLTFLIYSIAFNEFNLVNRVKIILKKE